MEGRETDLLHLGVFNGNACLVSLWGSRRKSEAQAVLGEEFGGIGVSDDYAAYQYLFSEHQLCWAHLLRKAIKLMLQHPTEPLYREFLDSQGDESDRGREPDNPSVQRIN